MEWECRCENATAILITLIPVPRTPLQRTAVCW